MACNVNKKQLQEAARIEYRRLAELYKQGIESDEENDIEDIESAMNTMKSIMNGDANKIKESIEDYENVAIKEVKKALGDVLEVRYSPTRVRQEKIVRATKLNGNTRVVTNKGTYTFNDGQDTSTYIGDTKRRVTIEGLGDVTKTLGSNFDTKIDRTKMEEQKDYKHGNPEHMKNMLNKLHTLGGKKATQAELDYLQDLLSKMKPKFFKDMKLFIREKTKKSEGAMEMQGKALGYYISSRAKIAGNEQTDAEIYMHELIHSVTAFAFHSDNSEAKAVRRELSYTMEHARENMTWKDLLPEVSIDLKSEEKIAKDMYDYMFSSENAADEFMAHALTNPLVRKKLEFIRVKDKKENPTLIEKIFEMFETLMDLVLGKYQFKSKDKNTYEQTLNLVTRLAEINARSEKNVREKEGMLTVAMEMVNNVDAALYGKLHEFSEKHFKDNSKIEELPANSGALAKATWLAKFMKKVAINPDYTKAAGLILTSVGLAPEGSIRGVFRDMSEPGILEKTVEWLGLSADKIDEARMSQITSVKKNVLDAFKNPVTEEQERAMLRVLVDTDLASLLGKQKTAKTKYSNKIIRTLLEDEAELDKAISRAKYKLEQLDVGNRNWHINQAHGLGYYMATHNASIVQNFNSENIAKGYGSTNYKKYNQKLVDAIDEVATLTALKYTEQSDKDMAASLMAVEWSGVKYLVDVYKGFKAESNDKLFDKNTHMVKGYSKEVFDDTIVMQVALASDKREMEQRGYELKKHLKPLHGEKRDEALALYVTSSYGLSEWNRSATRLNTISAKGMTVTDLKYAEGGDFAKERGAREVSRLHRTRQKLANDMMNGELDITKLEMGIAPLMDEDGKIVNYRYMMNKRDKEEYLKQDTRVSEIMGRSYGHVLDKFQSKAHNDKVLETILKDMKDNWTEGKLGNDGLTEYIEIGPRVHDEKMRELYNLLPANFKKAINLRKNKTIAVPRELLTLYFGYRQLSIMDIPGLQKITPVMIQSLIRMIEGWWMEAVKIVKTNILLKMPAILVGNFISNFLFEVVRGTSPFELVKLYRESFRDVKWYIAKHRELVDLKNRDIAGRLNAKEKGKIKIIEGQLAKNDVHELMELGMYQAIVEDVERTELRSNNKWKQKTDAVLNKAPWIVRAPLQVAYLSEETKWYKVNQEVLQISDLIARDAMNRKLRQKERDQVDGKAQLPTWWLDKYPSYGKKEVIKGVRRKEFMEMSKEQRHYALLESFVNYNKPSGNFEEYLNRMGVLMFTKYVKRMQRVIAKTGAKHPIKTLGLLMGQGFLIDAEMIFDQSLLSKGWYTDGFGPGNVVPFYSPLEHIGNILQPALTKDETFDFRP